VEFAGFLHEFAPVLHTRVPQIECICVIVMRFPERVFSAKSTRDAISI